MMTGIQKGLQTRGIVRRRIGGRKAHDVEAFG
jgi:hypothetical protein